MGARAPLSVAEKEHLYAAKIQGRSLSVIAAELGCSAQKRLDSERDLHNHVFASRASDCGGRPPLIAHPELLQPRRPYRLEWERALFDEQLPPIQLMLPLAA